MDFESFGKIARLSREIIITEKIDGTNAQIYIDEEGGFSVGSRNKWITPNKDNYGFAKWAYEHSEELMELGPGRHFGEWWGQGIQRKYGLKEKRFSLFNTSKWTDDRPDCCHVVPVLYKGLFDTDMIHGVLCHLTEEGSEAAPGFMNPEGIVIFHTQGNLFFKKTIKNDDYHKGEINGDN